MARVHIIPDASQLEASCELAREFDACFEYNDFFAPALMDDAARYRECIQRYLALDRDRSGDTLHGAFLDVTIHSEDARIRQVSERRVRQSMDTAQELGVRGVVFHTGLIPNYCSPRYTDNWLERNEAFWTAICSEYAPTCVYLENMFDMQPTLMRKLAERMAGVEGFGLCLDYAHARVFGGDPGSWVEQLAPYVRHVHVNDNDGADDLHLAVGAGTTDWRRYDCQVREMLTPPSVLVEVRALADQRKSLEFMRAHGLYPFARKG